MFFLLFNLYVQMNNLAVPLNKMYLWQQYGVLALALHQYLDVTESAVVDILYCLKHLQNK